MYKKLLNFAIRLKIIFQKKHDWLSEEFSPYASCPIGKWQAEDE